MAKARWRRRNGLILARRRWTIRPNISARRMAFAIIVEGARPQQVCNVFRWCGLAVPTSAQIYSEMRIVCTHIKAMANESMAEARRHLPPHSVIAFDGSWDHRRRGKACLFSVICTQTGQVIESVVVTKDVTDPSQIFCEKSSLMEAKALQKLIPKLQTLPNIVGYVHDNDAKARTIIEQSGWQITEYLDPGHCKKSFLRSLQNFEKDNRNVLKTIEKALQHWMWILVHSNFTLQHKVLLWQNTLWHMAGWHQYCIHQPMIGPAWHMAGNPYAMSALKKFLDSTQFIIEKCNGLYNTQANESLNRKKLKFASKDVRWGFSWDARVMAAVLSKNTIGWKFELYQRLGLDALPEEIGANLRRQEWAAYGRSILVKTQKYRMKRNEKRMMWRRGEQNRMGRPVPLEYERNPYLEEQAH